VVKFLFVCLFVRHIVTVAFLRRVQIFLLTYLLTYLFICLLACSRDFFLVIVDMFLMKIKICIKQVIIAVYTADEYQRR